MDAGPRSVRSVFRVLSGRVALALLLGCCATLSPLSAQQAASRVGYVDMQRLIDSAPHVLAARERLRAEFDARDRELTIEEARLAELDARLRDEGPAMAAEARDTLQRQADALRRSIERTQQRLRDELDARSREEIDRAWPLIIEAVSDYAREAGYDLVVQSPVIYVSGRIDITERVLERLRQDYAGRGTLP